MRRLVYSSILAGAALVAGGCKAGQATHRAEQMDARTSDNPQVSYPSVAHAAKPDAAAQTAPDGRSLPLIVCFGDSLTAGYGTDPGESYPDFLQADLDAQGYKYRVVNAGVSGNTTKDGINRLPGVVAMKPYLVIVEFGGNDGLRGLPIEDSRANLDTILAKLKASGSKVVIAGITLPPNYGAGYIKQFDETYTLLAKKYDLPLMPFLLKDVYNVPGMMQADETHATAAGNKIVAKDVEQLIAPLLSK
jgi:acyl-CoA thioesterase-1